METCGKCARERGRGDVWHMFEGETELVIDIPWQTETLLPFEIVDAIRDHEGIVRLEPDPQVTVAAVREVSGAYLGTVCPDCYSDSDWDFHQWAMFLAVQRENRRDSEAEPREESD